MNLVQRNIEVHARRRKETLATVGAQEVYEGTSASEAGLHWRRLRASESNNKLAWLPTSVSRLDTVNTKTNRRSKLIMRHAWESNRSTEGSDKIVVRLMVRRARHKWPMITQMSSVRLQTSLGVLLVSFCKDDQSSHQSDHRSRHRLPTVARAFCY